MQEVVKKSEEKYRSLFNSIDVGFYKGEVSFNENGKPVDIYYIQENPAAVRMMGKSFIGKYARQANSLYEENWYTICGDVALTGKSSRMERFSEADQTGHPEQQVKRDVNPDSY